MEIISLIVIGFGLSADSFMIVMLLYPVLKSAQVNNKTAIPLIFAGVQTILFVTGWLMGSSLFQIINSNVHWIACGLLVVIGVKMFHELIYKKHEHKLKQFSIPGISDVLLLAIATGLDALPAGISIGLLGYNIVNAALIIALITILMITMALHFGWKFAEKHVRVIAYAGALFLVIIGIRIFLYHVSL